MVVEGAGDFAAGRLPGGPARRGPAGTGIDVGGLRVDEAFELGDTSEVWEDAAHKKAV